VARRKILEGGIVWCGFCEAVAGLMRVVVMCGRVV
jgi:hypothetical protein